MTAPDIIERERMRAVEVWREMSSMPIPISGYEPIIQRHLLKARAEQIAATARWLESVGMHSLGQRLLVLATALEKAAEEAKCPK